MRHTPHKGVKLTIFTFLNKGLYITVQGRTKVSKSDDLSSDGPGPVMAATRAKANLLEDILRLGRTNTS